MFGLSEILFLNRRAVEHAQQRLFLFRGHREPSSLGQIPFASVVDTSGFRRVREIPVGTAIGSLSPNQAIRQMKPGRYYAFSSGQFEAVLAEYVREDRS
jgi:hypothetical protein